MYKQGFAALCLALLMGCASVNTAPQGSVYTSMEANIPQWGAIVELGSGRQISADELLDALAPASTLMVGEVHDNLAHHLIEQWLVTRLAERRAQGAVVLEMLDSDQQRPVADVQAWLRQGNQVRASRLRQIMHWDERWPWEQYGSLVEALMPAPFPVLAGNVSATERKRLMSASGASADALFPTPAIAARQREHIVRMHCGQIDQGRLNGMLAIQHARDLRMAQVLDSAEAPRLLFAGTLHTLRGQGAPQYLAKGPLDPGLKVLVMGEQGQNLAATDADYLWLLPAHDAEGSALVAAPSECDQPVSTVGH
ncbi:ChaN family lipoprotein [Pseudomonas sp. JQ170]|uniref:ChaN family lipoprotein n=1 Tax=unclassified Pseudomonas TaxID=196821 RepID=UPI00264F9CB1|nr:MULTISPECIES: ChaN family lipoprotein [unclassified Pseudomonas]MDN7143600.1 ChaN family lipoprotein [Pseudomonas sp. JQ170]WRO77771.1 ChaN family lipoprotein [Pseudomonas sp. 170C]